MAHILRSRRLLLGVRWALWAVFVVLCALCGSSRPAQAQATPGEKQAKTPEKRARPPELTLVPSDAQGFVHVRVSELWNSETGGHLRKHLAKELTALQREMESGVGATLPDVERFTLLWPTFPQDNVLISKSEGDTPALLVATVKPYNRAKVRGIVGLHPLEQSCNGKTYYEDDPKKRPLHTGAIAVHFVTERVYLVGLIPTVERVLTQAGRSRGPEALREALARAAEDHHVVAAFQVPRELAEFARRNLPKHLAALRPLLDLQSVSVTLRLSAESRLACQLTFPDADTAKAAQPAVKEFLALLRTEVFRLMSSKMADLALPRVTLSKKEDVPAAAREAPRRFDLAGQFLKQLDLAWQTAANQVRQRGTVVEVDVRIRSEVTPLAEAVAVALADNWNRGPLHDLFNPIRRIPMPTGPVPHRKPPPRQIPQPDRK